jgi:hypothetical protein
MQKSKKEGGGGERTGNNSRKEVRKMKREEKTVRGRAATRGFPKAPP